MMGLPYGEEIMTVGQTTWTQSTSVTDGQMDGQTEGQTDRITITKTVQRRASHGKNQRTMLCRVPHGVMTAKKWLDSIKKQKRRIDLKEV